MHRKVTMDQPAEGDEAALKFWFGLELGLWASEPELQLENTVYTAISRALA